MAVGKNGRLGWFAVGLLLDWTIPKADSCGLLFVLQPRPWLTLGYAGGAPSRRKIGNICEIGVTIYNLRHRNYECIRRVKQGSVQKCP